jgi:hypothetical protein
MVRRVIYTLRGNQVENKQVLVVKLKDKRILQEI